MTKESDTVKYGDMWVRDNVVMLIEESLAGYAWTAADLLMMDVVEVYSWIKLFQSRLLVY